MKNRYAGFIAVTVLLLSGCLKEPGIGGTSTITGKIYAYIGASPDLAQSFGLYFMKYRVQAYVISAFFTGLVGAALAVYLGAINPEGFTFYHSCPR